MRLHPRASHRNLLVSAVTQESLGPPHNNTSSHDKFSRSRIPSRVSSRFRTTPERFRPREIPSTRRWCWPLHIAVHCTAKNKQCSMSDAATCFSVNESRLPLWQPPRVPRGSTCGGVTAQHKPPELTFPLVRVNNLNLPQPSFTFRRLDTMYRVIDLKPWISHRISQAYQQCSPRCWPPRHPRSSRTDGP